MYYVLSYYQIERIITMFNAKKRNVRSSAETGRLSDYRVEMITNFDMKLSDIIDFEKLEVENLKREKERQLYNERKNAYEVEIIKEGKVKGGDGPDYYAEVQITDVATRDMLKLTCRNIFDFGYVINHEIDGEKVIASDNSWRTFKR